MNSICKRFLCFIVLLGLGVSSQAETYYIDPVNGSDTNTGISTNQAWRSFRNIITYNRPEYRPAGWQQLAAGEIVYLMDGVYSQILRTSATLTGNHFTWQMDFSSAGTINSAPVSVSITVNNVNTNVNLTDKPNWNKTN